MKDLMEIDKTRVFARWARKEGIDDRALCRAVNEMRRGLFDADLGGGLLKKRVARVGQGKRGGFRTLVATNRAQRWVFVFGFAKNDRANINETEEVALKRLATVLLAHSKSEIAKARAAGELIEVTCDEET